MSKEGDTIIRHGAEHDKGEMRMFAGHLLALSDFAKPESEDIKIEREKWNKLFTRHSQLTLRDGTVLPFSFEWDEWKTRCKEEDVAKLQRGELGVADVPCKVCVKMCIFRPWPELEEPLAVEITKSTHAAGASTKHGSRYAACLYLTDSTSTSVDRQRCIWCVLIKGQTCVRGDEKQTKTTKRQKSQTNEAIQSKIQVFGARLNKTGDPFHDFLQNVQESAAKCAFSVPDDDAVALELVSDFMKEQTGYYDHLMRSFAKGRPSECNRQVQSFLQNLQESAARCARDMPQDDGDCMQFVFDFMKKQTCQLEQISKAPINDNPRLTMCSVDEHTPDGQRTDMQDLDMTMADDDDMHADYKPDVSMTFDRDEEVSDDPNVFIDVRGTEPQSQMEDTRSEILHDGKLQETDCLSHTFASLSVCLHCARDKVENCCFRDFRIVYEDDKGRRGDETVRYHGLNSESMTSWTFASKLVPFKATFPDLKDFNRQMDPKTLDLVKRTSAKALLSILDESLQIARKGNVVVRPWQRDMRDCCDNCYGEIFITSYFCATCGQELCLACYQKLGKICEKYQGTRNEDRILQCTGRPSKGFFKQHCPTDFFCVQPFPLSTLEDECKEMAKLSLPKSQVKQEPEVKSNELRVNEFSRRWKDGCPIVVGCSSTKTNWTPKSFMKLPNTHLCTIVNESGTTKEVTFDDFFSTFGQSKLERQERFGDGHWRMQDWPEEARLRDCFSALFNDIECSLLMPDLTRSDGVSNMAAYWPKDVQAPDLGPKMYSAGRGESDAAAATACLRMETYDVVNLMLYTDTEAPTIGALWHVFCPQDVDRVRIFILSNSTFSDDIDPIQTKKHYLGQDELKKLERETGIKPFTYVQRKGQAVMVPAGSAFQICNLCDCINVTVHFLSPDSVQRCFEVVQKLQSAAIVDAEAQETDFVLLTWQLWYAWIGSKHL